AAGTPGTACAARRRSRHCCSLPWRAAACACCSNCAMRWRSATGSSPPWPLAVVAASGGDGGRSPAELGGRIAVGAAVSGGDNTPLDCARLSVVVAPAPPDGGVLGAAGASVVPDCRASGG